MTHPPKSRLGLSLVRGRSKVKSGHQKDGFIWRASSRRLLQPATRGQSRCVSLFNEKLTPSLEVKTWLRPARLPSLLQAGIKKSGPVQVKVISLLFWAVLPFQTFHLSPVKRKVTCCGSKTRLVSRHLCVNAWSDGSSWSISKPYFLPLQIWIQTSCLTPLARLTP